jgi:hypothetical protein
VIEWEFDGCDRVKERIQKFSGEIEGKISIRRKRRKWKKEKYQVDERGVNGRSKDITWVKEVQMEEETISFGRKRRKLKKDRYQGDERGVNGRRKNNNWKKEA